MVDKPGSGPLQDAHVSRTPSPQGQESERESQEGDSEARVANISTGGLITLSTLLLSGLLFQQHYSHTGHRLPGNYTAEGETWCTQPQQKVPKKSKYTLPLDCQNEPCFFDMSHNFIYTHLMVCQLRKPKTITFWGNVWNNAWLLTMR